MPEKLNTIKRTCQSDETVSIGKLGQQDFQITTEASELGRYRGGPYRALGFWRTVVDAENVLAVQRSLRPCTRKLDIGLPLFFGFGLAGPTHRFLGILPELISL
jgi:hypothetical protein